MQVGESSWHLLDAASNARAALGTDREPGRFCRGLIKAHDAASGGYGFMTAAQGASDAGLSSAWAVLPAYANIGDFSETDGLAAVQGAESGLWGYIDEAGTWVIKPSFGDTLIRYPEQ